MDTNTHNQKCTVMGWNPDRGFGFVTFEGRRVLVHISSISSRQDFADKDDLTGMTLVVYATEDYPRGARVTRAATLEEHERRERELLEASALRLEKEEEDRLFVEGANAFLDQNAAAAWSLMEVNPLKADNICHNFSRRIGDKKYFLYAAVSKKGLRGLSGFAETLTVEVCVSVVVRAGGFLVRDNDKYSREERREFVVQCQGSEWADILPVEDPFRMAEYARRYGLKLADAATAVASLGAGHLVTALQVVKGWTSIDHSYVDTAKRLAGDVIAEDVKGYAARNGIKAGEMVEVRGGYCSSEDDVYAFSGIGGDYDSWEEWVWEPWAEETVRRVGFQIDEISLVADEVIARLKAETIASDFALLKKKWQSYDVSGKLKTPEGKARLGRIIEATKKAEILKKMRLAGVRSKDAWSAVADPEMQKRLMDMAWVRKRWRTAESRGLHPDAQALLRRILTAAQKAEELKQVQTDLEWKRGEDARKLRKKSRDEADLRKQEQARNEKKQEDARFMTGSAWNALEGFKPSE